MLPIFYINLDKRTDRRIAIEHQLNSLGLTAKRISAVDGSQLTTSDINFVNRDNFIARMKRPISGGEIGCAMSHRTIWQKMLDDNIEFALIMEDDVVIDEKLLQLLTGFDNGDINDFDFINLSSNEPYYPDLNIVKKILTATKVSRNNNNDSHFKQLDWNHNWQIQAIFSLPSISTSPSVNDIYVFECTISPALGSGYILSKKAAIHFLQTSNDLQVPIDYIWRYAGGMLRQGFLATPLIIQKENKSDITGRNDLMRLTLKQRIKRIYLKNQSNPRKQDIKRMYG